MQVNVLLSQTEKQMILSLIGGLQSGLSMWLEVIVMGKRKLVMTILSGPRGRGDGRYGNRFKTSATSSVQSRSKRERQILYMNTYIWNPER